MSTENLAAFKMLLFYARTLIVLNTAIVLLIVGVLVKKENPDPYDRLLGIAMLVAVTAFLLAVVTVAVFHHPTGSL